MKKLLLLLSMPTLLFGQSIERYVIGSAGGTIITNDITISYTVGETFVSYTKFGNIIMTEGFQQGDQSTISSVLETKEGPKMINLLAYPNPTKGDVTLSISGDEIKGYFTIAIFNGGGKLLYMDRCTIDDKDIHIDMGSYAPGVYIVGVIYGDNEKVILIDKIE
jgi:hypothetical protein